MKASLRGIGTWILAFFPCAANPVIPHHDMNGEAIIERKRKWVWKIGFEDACWWANALVHYIMGPACGPTLVFTPSWALLYGPPYSFLAIVSCTPSNFRYSIYANLRPWQIPTNFRYSSSKPFLLTFCFSLSFPNTKQILFHVFSFLFKVKKITKTSFVRLSNWH